MQARYIAVEGAIGAGKTTLARRLAQTLGAELLLEAPEENPFLERFYRDPKTHALPAQLCFLLQRARQVEQLRQRDLFQGVHVADFLFEKDRLFAALNLEGSELALYDQIYERLSWEAPIPDCVIYLHAPVDVLMQRVRMRGRMEEQGLDTAYMERVCAAYTEFFSRHSVPRLVTVDTASLDLVHDPGDYGLLLQALAGTAPITNLPA